LLVDRKKKRIYIYVCNRLQVSLWVSVNYQVSKHLIICNTTPEVQVRGATTQLTGLFFSCDRSRGRCVGTLVHRGVRDPQLHPWLSAGLDHAAEASKGKRAPPFSFTRCMRTPVLLWYHRGRRDEHHRSSRFTGHEHCVTRRGKEDTQQYADNSKRSDSSNMKHTCPRSPETWLCFFP